MVDCYVFILSFVSVFFLLFTHRMEGGLIVDVGKTLRHEQVPYEGVTYAGDNAVAGNGGD